MDSVASWFEPLEIRASMPSASPRTATSCRHRFGGRLSTTLIAVRRSTKPGLPTGEGRLRQGSSRSCGLAWPLKIGRSRNEPPVGAFACHPAECGVCCSPCSACYLPATAPEATTSCLLGLLVSDLLRSDRYTAGTGAQQKAGQNYDVDQAIVIVMENRKNARREVRLAE